ncbi:MAG: hypothetical protein ACOX9E_03580 [Lentisphaeria bacterium]
MRAREIIIAVLMLVLSAVGAEKAADGHPQVAGDTASAKTAISQRFLDGFWATVPAEEPAPERAPAAAPTTPAQIAAPMLPPTVPALQLHAVPAWLHWLLPRWSCCVVATMLAIAVGVALVGVLRSALLELHCPRRLRQRAAVKALRAWRKTPAPSFAGLLQAFREFYRLPVGSDADTVAAVVGKTDAELAQLLLSMERQRFAPTNSPAGEGAARGSNEAPAAIAFAGESAANSFDVANAACNFIGEPAAGAFAPAPVGSTELGVAPPVCPGSLASSAPVLLAGWLRRRPQAIPGHASTAAAVLLAAAAVLALAVVIAIARGLAQQDDLGLAWNHALQYAAEHSYRHAFDTFLAIERQSPSSPELSRNLAALAAATGRDEDARAWRRHAQLQEQLRARIYLLGRDWRGPLAVPALLLLTAFIGFWVAAMGWPDLCRQVLAWRAWLLLPLLLSACCALLLVGHWRQCRQLQELAVVLRAQPLRVTPGEMMFEQAPVATTDPAQAQVAATGQGVVADSIAPLAQLGAGDCVLLRQKRSGCCFVSVNGSAGWLPCSALLPFRL